MRRGHLRLGIRRAEGRLELLVIQPTPFCNLDCDYCYLPQRDSKRRISEEVLRRCFEAVLASRFVKTSFTVVWHAGEPLVLPISFYTDALRLIRQVNKGGVQIDHSFQTNGTLIDSAWCAFLLENHVRIGVSVDGPAFLHDAHRRTRGGKGTHDRVMRGIRTLQEHGVEFHVISVLTEKSLAHADEIFQFYCDNGIKRVGFNIEEIEGVNESSSLDSGDVASGRVRTFMGRFLELVKASPVGPEVREFHGLTRFINSGDPRFLTRNQENAPIAIVSIDCTGNLSAFSPELLGAKSERYGDFILGNVLHEKFDAIVAGRAYRRLQGDIEKGVAKCRETCEYFGLCGGGSPSNKFFENGSMVSTETMHCRLSKKAIVDALLNHLEASLEVAACSGGPRL